MGQPRSTHRCPSPPDGVSQRDATLRQRKKSKKEQERCQGHSAAQPKTLAAIDATHQFRVVSANCGFLVDERVEGGARVFLAGGGVGALEHEPRDVGILLG